MSRRIQRLTGTAHTSATISPWLRRGTRSMNKLVINLKNPLPASNDCLPHAAMNLGSARGVGLQPRPGMVSRLVIQKQLDAWCFFRLDEHGGFVGESWHPTK